MVPLFRGLIVFAVIAVAVYLVPNATSKATYKPIKLSIQKTTVTISIAYFNLLLFIYVTP